MLYLKLEELYGMIPEAEKLLTIMESSRTKSTKGSNHNHQTWEGGYLDHVCETMNIACWMYKTSPRKFPFKLEDALLVLFLHDLEKPFKEEFSPTWHTKEDRRQFRDTLIQQNEIRMTYEQLNALKYVEGEHDYSNTERKMQPLAAFCHMCDVASARLWFAHGKEHCW